MTAYRSSPIVIGIGNAYRGDDGAGIVVARRLRERVSAGIRVMEATGDGAGLLDAWKGAGAAILVDAVLSGAPPGTIHRIDARSGQIPGGFLHCSTHAFGVAESIELARALNQLPPCLVVYGIEGADFSAGEDLSAAVAQSIPQVVSQILGDLRALTDRLLLHEAAT